MLRLSRVLSVGRGYAQGLLLEGHRAGKDSFLGGDNAGYAEEMLSLWRRDPSLVHASWDVYFRRIEQGVDPRQAYVEPPFDGLPPLGLRPASGKPVAGTAVSAASTHGVSGNLWKVHRLIEAYRTRGHLAADIDPLKLEDNRLPYEDRFLTIEQSPEIYGFSQNV